jgi:Conjugal transfer protein TraD
MTNTLEEKKKKLNEKIEKYELKKKLLEAKEKKKRASKFSEIGRLANQANIDHLDEQTLLGAFLEIAKMQNNKLKQWQEIATEFKTQQSQTSDQVFSIYFEEEPSKEVRKKMKELKFIWNRFKREYCGRGKKEDLENLLKGIKVKIEEIRN